MSRSLEGKIAVVTGAAGRIGSATCRRLAADGMTVFATDIDLAGVQSLAGERVPGAGTIHALQLDIGNAAEIAACHDEVIGRVGGIDVLFNNGFASDMTPRDGRVAEVDPDVWARQLAVNLTGPMLLSRAFIPDMIARGGGVILHTSSVAGIAAEDTRTGYSVTKAAILGLSRSIAVQYGKAGIRSNVIIPGAIVTSSTEHATFTPAMLDIISESHMTPRLGCPDDVAGVVAFLASDDAAFMTGGAIRVDGGLSAAMSMVSAFRQLARNAPAADHA